MDTFLSQRHCDRCGGDLAGGRTMSVFNTECICMDCADKEEDEVNYQMAVDADNAEIKKGNFNFGGIGR